MARISSRCRASSSPNGDLGRKRAARHALTSRETSGWLLPSCLPLTCLDGWVVQCREVSADVVGVWDVKVGVEGQGLLPVVACLVVFTGGVVGVAKTGVRAALLVVVTGLNGQDERGSVLAVGLVGLPGGVQGLTDVVERLGFAGAVAGLAAEGERPLKMLTGLGIPNWCGGGCRRQGEWGLADLGVLRRWRSPAGRGNRQGNSRGPGGTRAVSSRPPGCRAGGFEVSTQPALCPAVNWRILFVGMLRKYCWIGQIRAGRDSPEPTDPQLVVDMPPPLPWTLLVNSLLLVRQLVSGQ